MKWIKIEDKLPENNQDCWVCQHDNTVTRGEWIDYHEIFGSGFGNYEEFVKQKYIKYWMPYFTPEVTE